MNPAATTARNVGNSATVAAHLPTHRGVHTPQPGHDHPERLTRAAPREIPSRCSPLPPRPPGLQRQPRGSSPTATAILSRKGMSIGTDSVAEVDSAYEAR